MPEDPEINVTNPEANRRLPWNDENGRNAWDQTVRRATTDEAFRRRCLGSSDEAKAALSEAGNVEVPPELRVLFLDDDPDLNCAIVRLPPLGNTFTIPFKYLLKCCGYRPY